MYKHLELCMLSGIPVFSSSVSYSLASVTPNEMFCNAQLIVNTAVCTFDSEVLRISSLLQKLCTNANEIMFTACSPCIIDLQSASLMLHQYNILCGSVKHSPSALAKDAIAQHLPSYHTLTQYVLENVIRCRALRVLHLAATQQRLSHNLIISTRFHQLVSRFMSWLQLEATGFRFQ